MKSEKKYLGIDWGETRIGLSVGDNVLCVATPYGVVSNIKEVLEVINIEEIDEIVLGEPNNLRNHDKKFHEKYLQFKKDLKDLSESRVVLFDERLSSKGADALSGTKKTKAARDAVAAMIILQGYLDSMIN